MKTLNLCPSLLRAGYDTFSPPALKALFRGRKVSHNLAYDFEHLDGDNSILNALNQISVSGVQEKFPAIIVDGKICVVAGSERSTHILKPAPWDKTLVDRKMLPANEHLTMQIARQIYGIETADNGICFSSRGGMVYITRRFDILDDLSKLPMEDFASVVGSQTAVNSSMFKYQGSYEDIARGIRENISFWMVEMEKFFRLLVFNYIYANGDAHLKNFSLLMKEGKWKLSPAYDLLNTALHVDGSDFALSGGFSVNHRKSDIYERTGHPCRLDFERFGMSIGLLPVRIKKILNMFNEIPSEVDALISRSFLTEKMKRSYRRIIAERTLRFNRVSED